MKRKLLLLLLPLILCGIPTLAHDIEVDGIYYRYTNNNTELSVTYRGEGIGSYSNEYSGSVVIPDSVTYGGKNYKVTKISSFAFSGCSSLTSVTIPNSVTTIYLYAFSGCTSLTSIIIPNSVTSIDDLVFYGCTGLTSISIPNSVTSIGNSVFYGCTSLTSISIPNSVTSIGSSVFYGCTGLTSITIPNSVTGIGINAFRNCTGLKSVNIPNSVTNIRKYAFSGCYGLTSVIIPNSVTEIGIYAFRDCYGLTSITIPNSFKTNSIYSYSPFYNCNIKKVFVSGGELSSDVKGILPSGAEIYYIDDNFYTDGFNKYVLDKTNNTAKLIDMTDIQGNVTIPKFIKIEDSVQKQYNITSIAPYAIYGKQIYSLTIGENVQSIGYNFKEKPTKTIWLTNTPPEGYTNAEGTINYVANNQYTSFSNKKVYPYISSIFEVNGIKYVPVSPSERTCDAIDCLYDNTVENIHLSNEVSFKGISMKVNNIMDYICISNPYIKTLTIDSDHEIPLQAFKDCENLETVSLTNKGSIGNYAFSGCKKLNRRFKSKMQLRLQICIKSLYWCHKTNFFSWSGID